MTAAFSLSPDAFYAYVQRAESETNKKKRLGMSRELQQLVFERSRNVNVNVSVGDKAENCDPGH